MGDEMRMEPLLLLPEMLLLVGGLAALLAGSFLPRDRQWVARAITIVALVASIVASVVALAGPVQTVFAATYALDAATQAARIAAAGGTLLIVVAGGARIAGSPRESETYALLLLTTTGSIAVAGADDLLLLAVGFLLASIPLYGLIGFAGTARGAEATMKTYLLGALFGIVLLLGVTILSGMAGTSLYSELPAALAEVPGAAVTVGAAAVLAGLMFKVGAVPAHFWVPDAAQASSGMVAMFLTTVPKIGGVIAVYRLTAVLPGGADAALLVAILAAVTMTLGNLAAYTQDDPRRLLGWSTVGQAGFLLVPAAVAGASGFALPALLFYLVGYVVTNIAAFAVTAALPHARTLGSYRGIAQAHPWLALSLVVALLGLVGTPPTAVFVGKLAVGAAAWDGGAAWLTVALFLNSLFSLYYYLRWIAPMYRRAEAAEPAPPLDRRDRAAAAVAVTSAALSLAMTLAAGLLLPLMSTALAS